MAKSKKTGREYQSRKERGYQPEKRRYEKRTFSSKYDKWGQPITCGVIDNDTGIECPRRSDPPFRYRCEYHQELYERDHAVDPGGTSADNGELG